MRNEFSLSANHGVNKRLMAIYFIKKGYNFVPDKELRFACQKVSSVS